jgi:hypothetical protein
VTPINQPVIFVDTKKKELVGQFKNGGREWLPQGAPDEVRVHDFLDKELGKAIPYRVYDITKNQGWVSVGIDHDTAEFVTAAIGRWWRKMGRTHYPHANELLITADGGGSNGSRCRLWKVALQGLTDQLGIPIQVCHFHLAPANGTRSNIACSATSRKTGAAVPSSVTKSSFI